MEEDFIPHLKPQKFERREDVCWQWQADKDPWAKIDPAKRVWQDYSDDDCLIIEKAFSLNQEIAYLKDYEVDLKKMIQVNKMHRDRIRRVRRQENSRLRMEMSEPIAVVRDQKTMNEAFGTIQQFLDYIMKRTPDGYSLYQRLKTLSLDSKGHEFRDIVQKVTVCILKGAETREKIIRTRTGSIQKSYIDQAKRIGNDLKKNSTVLKDFLKAILMAYTMESFICYWLNELLRSEDWEEINVLAPYLVCLVYTFKLPEYIIKYQEPEPKGLMDILFGFMGKQRLLFLYRGTALAKEHLELYKSKKVEYFSWNGVTSTSRDKNIALKFTHYSLSKAKDLNESKVGVLFRIETNFASLDDCEGMIDLFENACSIYPDEQEVILAPGTVYKLQKIRLIEDDIHEIHLKVTKNFVETQEEMAWLGVLQDQAISKNKAIIDGLPSQKSFRLLELLKGNTLIRKIEIRKSKIEEHIMEEINKMRITTTVQKQDIKLTGNVIVVSSLNRLAHYFSAENLNDILMWNKVQFVQLKEGTFTEKEEEKMKTLILSEEALNIFQDDYRLKELCEKIKDEPQITSLDLSIKKLETLNDEMIYFLLQCIKRLKCLEVIRLKINKRYSVSERIFEALCQMVRLPSNLNQLSFGLTFSAQGLSFLKKSLLPLVGVKNLSLDFQFCNKISDEGLSHLKECLIMLRSLERLSLNFEWCKDVSDEGLNHLKRGLMFLTSLQRLSLDFQRSSNISDEGLTHLRNCFVSLPLLQHLSLNFLLCINISDEGLNRLNNGLKSLISLMHLSLNFTWCSKISDEGLNHLKRGLISLPSLLHLSLSFNWCKKISDEGVNHLKEGLISLKSLEHLILNFSKCHKVSDEGISKIKESLISFKSLRILSLDFDECSMISNKGLGNLTNALMLLKSLQHLSLNFCRCNKISLEGINRLGSGLKSIRSLQHLSLNFSRCQNNSDKELNDIRRSLKPLTSLQHFSLVLDDCSEIPDKEQNHLNGTLQPQTSLQPFSLDFSKCKKT